MIEKLKEIFGGFPKIYWVVQSFELFERAAYYTMMPIIVWHAIRNIGVDPGLALILTAFMYPLQYGLPIFSGALAEKFGYRRQMLFAFVILFFAYMFLSFAVNSITIIFSLMLIGIGVGTYKPLISSTIAKCTPQNVRNRAYSVYYMVVNIAAGFFPLVWALLLAFGFFGESIYPWVFRIGAIFFLVNILVGIFIFREVPRSGEVKTVGDALNNIKTAFKDKKFVVMALLYGGFWALYATMLNVLPTIFLGYKIGPFWITAMLLGVFNPLTIIIVGPYLAKFSEKIESLKWLMGGVFVYTIGMALVMTLNWVVVIIGIVVASIGEFMSAPGYMAFVSKLAPKEKVSAYFGCNYIAYMLGLFGGTLVFGLIANWIAIDLGRPHLMYGIIMSCGLLLVVMFIFYYRTWGQDIIERARKIKELEEAEEKDIEPTPYEEPALFKIFDYKSTPFISILLIPIILFSTFSMGTMVFINPYTAQEESTEIQLEPFVIEEVETGYTQENSYNDITFEITKETSKLNWVNCTLTWQDEASSYLLGTNEPDEFRLEIIAPNGETVEESQLMTSGPIGLSVPLDYTEEGFTENYVGEWTLRIEAGACGDDYGGPLGLRVTADDGNAWTLNYSYTYMAEAEES